MSDLAGRSAIVTGASSGIGSAVARELSAAGMRLLLTARRRDRLEQLAAELGESRVLAADVTDPALPDALLGAAVDAFGGCDVLVNNAGILEIGAVDSIDLDRMCRMVRVNVEAAFRLAYSAVRHFRQAGSGHLVNVSSVLGTKTRPTAGAYAGTKFAVEALSEALRLELAGSGVRVSVVAPGMVMTELHDHLPTHPAEQLGIRKPLQPEDVARSVRYVLEQPEHVHVGRLLVLPFESPV